MRRLFALGFVGAAIAGALVAVVAIAVFTDQQTTSGTVSMASVGDGGTVYICDATGFGTTPLHPVTLTTGQTIQCVSDDNGPNEAIFEADERLLPGTQASWDIIFWNTSNFAWDIPDFNFDYPNLGKLVNVQVASVSDPGSPCTALPRIDASIVFTGRVGPDGTLGPFDEDFPPDGGALKPSQGYRDEFTGIPNRNFIPHVQPGDGEILRLRAIVDPFLPDGVTPVGNECADSQWSISISWSVVPH